MFEDEIARKGYVHIEIVDNVYSIDSTVDDMGGEFIVIAQPSL